MNNKKIRPHECSFRPWGDAQFEYINPSCGNYSSKEIWGMDPPFKCKSVSDSIGPFASLEGASPSPPSAIMHPNSFGPGSRCVGSTPSAFYAAERLMGFPRIDDEYSQSAKGSLELPSFLNNDIHVTHNLNKQNDVGSSRDTLESLVKFPVHNNCNLVVFGMHPQNHIVENERGLSKISSAIVVPNKTRIRWSQDLHEKFVESINFLGGADKATPKGILKQMNSEGLTIYHVKSHLQKYRTAKHMPDPSMGKPQRSSSSGAEQLDPKAGMQISEALHMQIEVQKRLHEQLETQRKLQIRIEEQGRKLQKMFEEQLKANGNSIHTEDTGVSEDVLILSPEEGSKNTCSPSKIS